MCLVSNSCILVKSFNPSPLALSETFDEPSEETLDEPNEETLNEPNEETLDEPNACVPYVQIGENQLFQIESLDLDNLVSTRESSGLLYGGNDEDKKLLPLELCFVSSSSRKCDDTPSDECVRDDKKYRIRVERPIPGYLQIYDGNVRIVPAYYPSTPLTLYREWHAGLKIAQLQDDGSRLVFATNGNGQPISIEKPDPNADLQAFILLKAKDYSQQQC